MKTAHYITGAMSGPDNCITQTPCLTFLTINTNFPSTAVLAFEEVISYGDKLSLTNLTPHMNGRNCMMVALNRLLHIFASFVHPLYNIFAIDRSVNSYF